MEDKFEETEIMICECNSLEHQAKFYYWKGENYDIFNVVIHLSGRGFFYRFWYGIKYIFGFKCRYGAWDEFLMSQKDRQLLRDFLNKEKSDTL